MNRNLSKFGATTITTRLTAKDAAKKAVLKRVELDAKKSADKDAAKLVKQIDRQWNLQKLSCIREALGGNSYVDIKKKLISYSKAIDYFL